MPDDSSGGDPLASAATPTTDLESTFRLLERARTGDQDALNRLLARHVTPLRRWARGRLPKWARDAGRGDGCSHRIEQLIAAPFAAAPDPNQAGLLIDQCGCELRDLFHDPR